MKKDKLVEDGLGMIDKISKAIFDDDIEDLGAYIKNDVIKPQVNKIIYTTITGVTNGISNSFSDAVGYLAKKLQESASKKIYGDAVPPASDRYDHASYKNYSRSYSSTKTTQTKTSATPLLDGSAPVKSSSPKIAYFQTRGEAEGALMCLREVLDEYGQVRVADYYEVVGMDSQAYTDNSYGWFGLNSAEVRRGWDMQYYINLPRPVDLNSK